MVASTVVLGEVIAAAGPAMKMTEVDMAGAGDKDMLEKSFGVGMQTGGNAVIQARMAVDDKLGVGA